jgi:hypothetical protein
LRGFLAGGPSERFSLQDVCRFLDQLGDDVRFVGLDAALCLDWRPMRESIRATAASGALVAALAQPDAGRREAALAELAVPGRHTLFLAQQGLVRAMHFWGCDVCFPSERE